MLRPATSFYIWASLGLFCALACLAECERCPSEGVCKPVDCSACRSSVEVSPIGLQNTYLSFFVLDNGHDCQKKVLGTENVGCVSEVFSFLSTLYDAHTKEQCSGDGDIDIDGSQPGAELLKQTSRQESNASWSSDDFTFHIIDGGTLSCFMNIECPGQDTFLHCVNNTDQIVLLLTREAGFITQNIEIEKSSSSEVSSTCLTIDPKKLDWGENYLYYPSVAFLKLKNVCDEHVIKVYQPFSTNSQFYSFNYSDVALGPGEVTSISFVFLPKSLGVSSGELVLQTSVGGFLVKATGSVIESPHRLLPLVVVDVSSGGWLLRKLSPTSLFDEAIHLEEVTPLRSVTRSCDSLLDEAICGKLDPQGFQEHSFCDANKNSNGEQLETTVSPDSEGRVLGAVCMTVLRQGKKEIIIVPFKIVTNNTATCKDTMPSLSASIEAVGRCNESEKTVSVSVRNNAPHLLKVVRLTDVTEGKKLLKIKYMEGILLFPGSVTQVALVTYDASDIDFDSFVEMARGSMKCGLQIVANDSSSPSLEVPCQDIFETCPRKQSDLLLHLPGVADRRYIAGPLRSTKSTSVSTKAMGDTNVDDFVLQKWKDQSIMSDNYVLGDHELLFPMVPLDRHFTKSITIKNPSQQPVTVQLILNSGETVNNCKLDNNHIPSLSPSNLIHYDSASQSRYGFSMTENTVTEAFLHPYGMATLGPIIFHPSNRCEWTSSALIRNNLSGVEQLSLRGFGGLYSLVLLEGSELKQKLDFNMNLPSLNASFHISSPSVEETRSVCLKPLSKKLVALNAGDFDVEVERIGVSGVACGLDGFLVNNCKGFSLAPGESLDLEVSFQTDFSGPIIKRNLEFKLSTGMLVLPMQASIPFNMLNLCRKSIFWVRVKKCCVATVLATVLMFLLFWLVIIQMEPSDSVDYIIKGDKRSIRVVRPKEKSSTLHLGQVNGKSAKVTKSGRSKPVQRDEAESVLNYVNARERNSKRFPDTSLSSSLTSKSIEIDSSKEAAPVSLTVRTRKDKRRRPRKKSGAASGLIAHLEVSSSQSGNSTPPSPLSPNMTFSPKGTCTPSVGDRSVDVKANTFKTETVAPVGVSENYGDNLSYTQQTPFCPNFTGSRPTLSSSATFPGTGRCALSPPCLYPSRLALSPDARAPGPRTKPQKLVQAEERANTESRFVYDIWGNHLSGIHLMGRSDGSFDMMSDFVKGHSGSFFVRDPFQILLNDSAPVTVSRSSEEG
ncbi:hypothetical protein vseg_015656 [Gypsophila vaccaria]